MKKAKEKAHKQGAAIEASGGKSEAVIEIIKVPLLARDIDNAEIALSRQPGEKPGEEITKLSFSASSETPIERFFGDEVLSHETSAIRMERIKRGNVPLLFNHNWDDVIGVVDGARIEKGRLLMDAHLFATARAQDVAAMLKGGLRNISIGYRLHSVEENKETGVFTARDWEPFEASVVSIPADPTVGIGRAGEELEVRMFRQPAVTATTTEVRMDSQVQQTAAAGPAEAGAREVKDDGYDPVAEQSKRAAAIRRTALGMEINDERAIQHWIASGKSYDVIAEEMIKVKQERSRQAVQTIESIGLTPAEAKRFSMTRAINAIIYKDWTKAGFEADVSKATAQRAGKYMNEHTFMVPAEVQNLMSRVMITGTAAQGGYVVGTDLVSFIDVLRNRSVAFQAGVTTMAGLVGQVAIPKKTTAGSFAWLAETGTATASEMVLSQVTLAPKKLAGYQEYSKQLMIQSTPDVETLVLGDLAAGLAVAVDLAILVGTGANQPTGIRFTAGLGTANPTSGTAITYADMIKFQTTIAAANAMFPGFTYITTPTVAGILMGKTRFVTSGTAPQPTGDTPVWLGGILDGVVVGQRAMATQQLPAGVILAGDYSQAIFGQWSGMEIEVNPYANFQADIVGVKATIYADVAVRYPGAFAVGTGVTG
jgi:HK97 family phage major capsid protein/HK97 family phage prohead protease